MHTEQSEQFSGFHDQLIIERNGFGQGRSIEGMAGDLAVRLAGLPDHEWMLRGLERVSTDLLSQKQSVQIIDPAITRNSTMCFQLFRA